MNKLNLINNALLITRNTNKTIAVDGYLPWYNEDDIHNYECNAAGFDVIIMGHNTLHYLPRRVPNKKIYVLCSNPYEAAKSAVGVFWGLNTVLQFANLDTILEVMHSKASCLVIGGAKTAKTLLPYVTEMCISTVKETPKSDISQLQEIKWDYNPIREFRALNIIKRPKCEITYYVRKPYEQTS